MNNFLGSFLNILFLVLYAAIIGRIFMSFIDQSGQMRVSQILFESTEPILGPLRRIIPSVGMFDFSPMIALLIISALQRMVAANF